MSNGALFNAFGEDQAGVFDDDEGGLDARESLSSSDDLASRNGGDLETRSVTFSNYQTPETRSTAGSVAHRAKEKLAALCGGRKCIVTHEIAPHACIEVAHLLPRATSGSVLSKLEFAFGLRYRQMHIDTTGNLEHINVHLHRTFDHAGWFLLPPSDVLEKIYTFMATPPGERRSYKEVFSATEKFKYRLVPLRLIQDNIGIWRRKSSSPAPNPVNHPFPPSPVYEQIYPIGLDGPAPKLDSLPIVESRANPFFVVANAGPKLTDNLSLLPAPWAFHRDIQKVITIWTMWTSIKPTQEWRAAPYSRDRQNGGGGEGGSQGRPGDGSPVPRRRQPSRPASKSAGGPAGNPSGHGLAHGAADLPELDNDHRTASTESDNLTQDAVRFVPLLDRAEFIQKWLEEPHGMNVPDVGVVE